MATAHVGHKSEGARAKELDDDSDKVGGTGVTSGDVRSPEGERDALAQSLAGGTETWRVMR